MKHITREELILEFCKFTVDKMDEQTLKHIAMVTLCANIKEENEEGSTYADWEDYVARKDGLHVYFRHGAGRPPGRTGD